MNKEYLGDSVYVEMENGMLRLTTENVKGSPSNIIYLEHEVMHNLLLYLQRLDDGLKHFKNISS